MCVRNVEKLPKIFHGSRLLQKQFQWKAIPVTWVIIARTANNTFITLITPPGEGVAMAIRGKITFHHEIIFPFRILFKNNIIVVCAGYQQCVARLDIIRHRCSSVAARARWQAVAEDGRPWPPRSTPAVRVDKRNPQLRLDGDSCLWTNLRFSENRLYISCNYQFKQTS